VLGLQEAAQRDALSEGDAEWIVFTDDEDSIIDPNDQPVTTSQRQTQPEPEKRITESVSSEVSNMASFDSGDEWNIEDMDEDILEPSADFEDEVLELPEEPRCVFDVIPDDKSQRRREFRVFRK